MGVHADEVDDGRAPDEEGDDTGADSVADVGGWEPEDDRACRVPEKALVVQLHDTVVISIGIEECG